MQSNSSKSTSKKQFIIHEAKSEMPLLRNNFALMIAAGLLIVAGFVLIAGSSSTTEGFNADIFSTRRIVVGPMLSFLGFVLMGIAIIVKPRSK